MNSEPEQRLKRESTSLEDMAHANPLMTINLLASTSELHAVIEMGISKSTNRLVEVIKGKSLDDLFIVAFKKTPPASPHRKTVPKNSAVAQNGYMATSMRTTIIHPTETADEPTDLAATILRPWE